MHDRYIESLLISLRTSQETGCIVHDSYCMYTILKVGHPCHGISATPPWTALKEQKYGSLAKTSRVTTGSANSPPGFLLLTIMQPFRPFDSVEGGWRPVLSSVPVSVHVAQELES